MSDNIPAEFVLGSACPMGVESLVKRLLQNMLGFDQYLYWFALAKIYTFRWDKGEGRPFLHFLKQVPDRGVVLDVGANVGIMTVLFARKLKNAQIHAFEPMPANFAALQHIVHAFKLPNVTLHQLALGDSRRKVRMRLPVHDGVKMQGTSHVVQDPARSAQGEDHWVPMDRLDALEEFQNVPVVAVKIDVEDFESYVLQGGLDLIRRNRPLLYMELWDSDQSPNRTRCLEMLGSLGYQARVYGGRKKGLIPPEQASPDEINYFFLPESSPVS